jgi:hypothetical protein
MRVELSGWRLDRSLTRPAPSYLRPFQELHEGVISALAEASAATRSAFLDLAFLRKQRQRGGGASSRSWYVTVDHWITGTVAATEAEQAFAEEVRRGAAGGEVPLPAIKRQSSA